MLNRRILSALAGLLMLAAMGSGLASTPARGRIGPASGSSTQTDFAPVAGVSLESMPSPSVACAPATCDAFDLDVALPENDEAFYASHAAKLFIHFAWSTTASRLDVYAYDPRGNLAAGPGTPDNAGGGLFEDLTIDDPLSGHWTIYSVGGIAAVPTPAHAVMTLTYRSRLRAKLLPLPRAGDPHFSSFAAPNQRRDALQRPNAGEPTIGADWKTGAIMYMAGTQVWRITFDDSKSPARARWLDVTPPQLGVLSEDSVIFTDRVTNRTLAAELNVACNHAAFTDDDGTSWGASEGCGPPAGPDHPTVGGGPYARGGSSTNSYPHAVYDCSQYGVSAGRFVNASCSLSRDGGFTFQSPPTMIGDGSCAAIHGHIRIGPDGYAYVPPSHCGTRIGVIVSGDNNKTWNTRVIPDSTVGLTDQDPSVDIGPDNAVYLGYVDKKGHPKIAVSHDHGVHWSRSVDVGRFRDPGETENGLPEGIQNTEFAEVIAGGPGRAAFAFLGTGTSGDTQSAGFSGVWYLFVSYTYDGGKTWHTVNATPRDPVQRGCIWNGGGSNPCRNLLDFNDITIDNHGRVLVSYTDGCTKSAAYSCVTTKRIDQSRCIASEGAPFFSTASCTYGRISAVARQRCGLPLLAAYDSEANSCVRSSARGTNVLGRSLAEPVLPKSGQGDGVMIIGIVLVAAASAVSRWLMRARF